MVTTLTRLNRYLYEVDFKEKLKYRKLTLDEALELITGSPDNIEEIISGLAPDVKEKIEEIREGGLL
jgi:hypothetical protein